MISYAEILDRAIARKGGREAVEALLPVSRSAAELAAIPDDRWLSMIEKRIFQAGFVWKVIEDKWPAFEEAFAGFEPRRLALWSDEELEEAGRHPGIVRNWPKILTVRDNARFLADLADEHGSAAKFFANWPDGDYVGLLEVMAKRGSRLGGNTAQYVLRFMGKPAFILSEDVTKALIEFGVVEKAPSSKAAMRAVQAAFDGWCAESGRDLSAMSRLLAMTQ